MAYRKYLYGTSASESFYLTDAHTNYRVYAGSGNDYVSGGTGDDLVYGQNGNDYLVDNLGSDVLNGGNDDDWIYAGAGDDRYYGGAGEDTLSFIHAQAGIRANLETGTSSSYFWWGDAANVGQDLIDGFENVFGSYYGDVITGDAGDNDLYGYYGMDTLTGGAGNDRVFGGNDDDTMIVGTGDDTYDGGKGSDWLKLDAVKHGVDIDFAAGTLKSQAGATGDDDIGNNRIISVEKVYSGQGDDFVDASDSKAQTVYLHLGDDTVIAGAGDTYYGQGGTDTLDFSRLERVSASISNGTDHGVAGDITFSGFENFIGTDGDDYFSTFYYGRDITLETGLGDDSVGISADNAIVDLGDGDDYLDARSATVTASGGAGDDSINLGYSSGDVSGGEGNDSFIVYQVGSDKTVNVDGGTGWDDLWVGGSSSQALEIDMRNGTVTERDGAGTYGSLHFSGIEEIMGDGSSDLIHGTSNGDVINGEYGKDTVFGNAGADTITGGGDDDILSGGDGDDDITGGFGDDLLTGGAGQDAFHFGNNFGADRITDFNDSGPASGGDLLYLHETMRLIDGTSVYRASDMDTNLDGQIDANDTGFAQNGSTLVMNFQDGTLRLDGVDTLYYDSFVV